MVAQKRRRVRPKNTPKKSPARKKRPASKAAIDWKGGLLKTAIGAIILLNGVLLFFFIRQCSVTTDPPTPPKPPEGPIQIEVLNGCNKTGIARKWTDYLRVKGFDVVRTDNYDSFNVLETVIIDRRGNVDNAIKVARAMGLSEMRVLQEANETYLLDVSVVLGKDYYRLKGWHAMEVINESN